jgi:hypothetical protein
MTGIFDLDGAPLGDVIKKELNISIANNAAFRNFAVQHQYWTGHFFQNARHI